MDNKRFLLFVVLSMGILMGWPILERKLFPRPAKIVNKAADKKDVAAKDGKTGADKSKDVRDEKDLKDKKSAGEKGENPVAKKDPKKVDEVKAADPAVEKKPLPKFGTKSVEIGSPNFDSGYRLRVTLSTLGAGIEFVEFNDPRYRDLSKKHGPLKFLNPGVGQERTFQTDVKYLGMEDLQTKNWEIVSERDNEVVFRHPSLDGNQEVIKTYRVQKVENSNDLPAYQLVCEITLKNKASQPHTLQYVLQGPVGLMLDNIDNTQKYRDIVAGFISEKGNGAIDYQVLTATALSEAVEGKKVEEWKRPAKFLGVDTQYFAALVLPQGDQEKEPYLEKVHPAISGGVVKDNKNLSDTTLVMTSKDISVPAAENANTPGSVTHTYNLYVGPKRDELLEPLVASNVIDYGWFGWISRPMLALLKTFYGIFGSYGVAIICLTIVVRGCMFPISIRQARSAAVTQEKMAKLQPELNALKEKHGNDKEKFFRAQMDLFAKHNYNPLQAAGGCLLVFLQLPVFMGLYNALNHAVDLRLAKFLWIDNLAAPDALFALPFKVPFLGWTDFNLLPIITVILYVIQQKMLMPPPMNEEQAMQQKMMNYMMIFMGAMFYRVPAGLCVYFIASSLWGLAERKLLPKASTAKKEDDGSGPDEADRKQPPSPSGGKGRSNNGDGPENAGFLAKLLRAADKEVSTRRTGQERKK